MRAAADVLIRGAGPVGCALALALQDSPLRVTLRGEAGRPADAFRPIALSYASRLILERVGAWPLAATPIETIRVSQLGQFGRTQLRAADAGVPALGYVVDYAVLMRTLRAALAAHGMQVVEQEGAARCVVHAEGSAPDAIEKRYAQHAIVARVRFDRPAGVTAHERFTSQGPLAMLPLEQRFALIWSTDPARAQRLAECPAQEFLRELAAAAGPRFGKPLEVASRSVQPLVARVRSARIGERAVYIGNAAQTLHPVAGQGLNLGLRDAWDLAQALRNAADPGEASLLARYSAQRRLDTAATFRVTDLLARAFLGHGRLAGATRGAALTALDVLPWPRRFFARRMIFGPSALP
jgi:2-octaprenyl-6-methoxyphenol hydroxylase